MMGKNVVELIIRGKDLASGVIKKFERNMRATVRVAKDVARDLLTIGAAATGAVVALVKMSRAGAEVVGVKQAFARVTLNEASALSELRQATGGTIADLELMRYHNQAVALGAAKSTSEFARQAAQAKALGRALGIDATEALEKYTVGLARQSKLRLDDLGIQLDVEEANRRYAAANNLVAASLTDVQKAEAFRTAAMQKADELIQQMGGSQLKAAEAADRFAANIQNLKNRVNEFVATSPAVQGWLEEWGMILTSLSGTSARVQGEMMSLANASMGALSDRASEYAHALAAAADESRSIDERSRALAALGVTGTEAQQLLDFVNARIRLLKAAEAAAVGGGEGGGAGETRAPGLSGTRAEKSLLLNSIRKAEEELKQAKLAEPLAAAGEKADAAAKKVKDLADELARLNGLAEEFGGKDGLFLDTFGIPPLDPNLLRPQTPEASPFRGKKYSLAPEFGPGDAERGLPFGDRLTMSPKGAASEAYAKSLKEAEGRFGETAGIVSATMGNIAADVIRGTATVSSAVSSMIGTILDRVVSQSNPLLGGVLGGIFAIGSALFGRNGDPVRVRVSDFESAAERKLSAADKRPIRITNVVESGGRPISEIEREMFDRQDRDEVVRFPAGSTLRG